MQGWRETCEKVEEEEIKQKEASQVAGGSRKVMNGADEGARTLGGRWVQRGAKSAVRSEREMKGRTEGKEVTHFTPQTETSVCVTGC